MCVLSASGNPRPFGRDLRRTGTRPWASPYAVASASRGQTMHGMFLGYWPVDGQDRQPVFQSRWSAGAVFNSHASGIIVTTSYSPVWPIRYRVTV